MADGGKATGSMAMGAMYWNSAQNSPMCDWYELLTEGPSRPRHANGGMSGEALGSWHGGCVTRKSSGAGLEPCGGHPFGTDEAGPHMEL
jgi:hypothetical protein